MIPQYNIMFSTKEYIEGKLIFNVIRDILFSFVCFFRDGASLCGVFCAVFNCIQQIKMDDSVDVFTTVRQLQTRRPELCVTQVFRYSNSNSRLYQCISQIGSARSVLNQHHFYLSKKLRSHRLI